MPCQQAAAAKAEAFEGSELARLEPIPLVQIDQQFAAAQAVADVQRVPCLPPRGNLLFPTLQRIDIGVVSVMKDGG